MMSLDRIIKQIEILSVMMEEDRPDIEKQIIHDELVKAYRDKVFHELSKRLTEEVHHGM